ncbi:hypothetical protein [Flexivirga sp.]|uniref:hypothetical protein n=1 Tax=Flexivirga sp. TaxID=1962927 RepID=UPI003F7D3A70
MSGQPACWPTSEQKRHAAWCPRDERDAFEELDRALAVVRTYSHSIATEVCRPHPDTAAIADWRRASDIASAEVARLLAETSAWLAERGL